MSYYTRHGQLIYTEPRGRFAGYEWPQISIHRGQLHEALLETVRERLGADAIVMNHKCTSTVQDDAGVAAHFEDASTGRALAAVRGAAAVGCDGIHSVLRRQLFPDEGPPAYQGINMWRAVSRWKPFHSGATMVQAGWLDVGKMVIYPISRDLDARPAADNGSPSSSRRTTSCRTGTWPASSTTCCRPLPTGISRGSTPEMMRHAEVLWNIRWSIATAAALDGGPHHAVATPRT